MCLACLIGVGNDAHIVGVIYVHRTANSRLAEMVNLEGASELNGTDCSMP